jgi:hypothetical protein
MDGPPAADPRPGGIRILAAIHFALVAILFVYAVSQVGQPCDAFTEPGCDGSSGFIGLDALIGLIALGVALVLTVCLAIRALFDRSSPLVVVDAFVGAGYAPSAFALPLTYFDLLMVVAVVGIATLATVGLVVAASDAARHLVERSVAIVGLIGIALLFASTRTSGTTVAVLVPLLGIAAVVVAAALGPRRPKPAV